MTTTPHEKNRLISDHLWMIHYYGHLYASRTMSESDYEEAESDAMLAISKAIDNYDETLGTLKTFIRRYIVTSFRRSHNANQGKRRSRQTAFEQSVSCFSDLSPDGSAMPDYGKPDVDQDAKIWKEMVIRTVKIPRHRRILNMRLDGLTFIEIGDRVGVTKQRAHQIYEAANAEIRENFRKKDGEE